MKKQTPPKGIEIVNFDYSKRKEIEKLIKKRGGKTFRDLDEFLIFSELFRDRKGTVGEFTKQFPKQGLLFLAIYMVLGEREIMQGFTPVEKKNISTAFRSLGANLIGNVFKGIFGQ